MREQSTVPDFFQEDTSDALRSQIDWLKIEFDVDDSFLAKLLGTEEATFANWRLFNKDLPPGQEDTLRRLWQMTLHLLSFLNFDRDKIRGLLLHRVPDRSKDEGSTLAPPWNDMSLKDYLEQLGGPAIEKVDFWLTGLRFGDPYAA